jgi:hypothetical protein
MPTVEQIKNQTLSEDPLIMNDDLRHEIKSRFDYAKKNMNDWEEMAKQDMAFGLGDQWTSEEMQKLKDAGRPALTFNRIKPLIKLISGYQRENTARIKVNPEGGEDKVFSEAIDRMIKHIDKTSHLTHKMAYWFDDGLYTGKGWLEAVITYENDPIRGELRFLQRSPYQILVDPDFNEYDLNEWPRAQFLFKCVRLTKSVLKMLYPKYKRLIDGFVSDSDDMITNGSALMHEGSDDDYGNRPNRTTVVKKTRQEDESGLKQDEKFTVKEYWRHKLVKRYFIIDKETGEPKRFETKESAENFANGQGGGKIVPRDVPEMWVAAFVGGFILQDIKSLLEPHYSGFPFFRFLSDWSPSAETEELKVQGVVRALKDPQREKNKSKSQYLHILNTQANSGWVGDDDALTPEGWKKLEEMGSSAGITVKKKKGSELREIQAKLPQQGHLVREQQADEEFKQISGVNPDLLGIQDKTASGRAIRLRIQQAVLALVHIFHNYRYSKEILGRFILAMVPQIYDTTKGMKVLGEQYMRSVQSEKYPEGITKGVLEAFFVMIKDARYDVFVSEADQNKTIRNEIFEDLRDLQQAGIPVPPDLFVDYMDLPNSDEVKKKFQEQQAQAIALEQAKQAKKA